MGLVLVFSVGAIGTAATALRLWKNVVVWSLYRYYERRVDVVSGQSADAGAGAGGSGSGSDGGGDVRRLSETAQLHLLSCIELGVIAVCANLPTLTGGWRRLKARATAKARPEAEGQRKRQLVNDDIVDGKSGRRSCRGGGGGGGGDRVGTVAASHAIRMEPMTTAAVPRVDAKEARSGRRKSVATVLTTVDAAAAASMTDDGDGKLSTAGYYSRFDVDDEYDGCSYEAVDGDTVSQAPSQAAGGWHGTGEVRATSSVEQLVLPERLV